MFQMDDSDDDEAEDVSEVFFVTFIPVGVTN